MEVKMDVNALVDQLVAVAQVQSSYAVEQAAQVIYIQAFYGLLVNIFVFIGSLFAAFFLRKNLGTFFLTNQDTPELFFGAFVQIIGLFVLLLSSISLLAAGSTLAKLVNPEWFAIQEIISLLT